MTEPPIASVYHPTAPSTSFSRPCSKTTKNLFYWQVSEHTVRIISHCHYCPIQCWFVIPGPFSWQVLTCQMLAHSFRISIQIPMGWQRRFDRFFFCFVLDWYPSDHSDDSPVRYDSFSVCVGGAGGGKDWFRWINLGASIVSDGQREREREREKNKIDGGNVTREPRAGDVTTAPLFIDSRRVCALNLSDFISPSVAKKKSRQTKSKQNCSQRWYVTGWD